MSSSLPFSQRLGAFKQRFQQVLGGRGSGYDELTQLEQPLVGDDNAGYGGNDDYQQSHGVSRPYAPADASFGYGPGVGGAASGLPGQVAQTIPSQVSWTCVFSCIQLSSRLCLPKTSPTAYIRGRTEVTEV